MENRGITRRPMLSMDIAALCRKTARFAVTSFSCWLAVIIIGMASPVRAQEGTNINGLQGLPTLSNPNPPGGWDAAGAAAHSNSVVANSGGANITVYNVRVVDANDNPISVTPGVPFFVEVDWEYDNPSCTNYTVSRVING